MARTTTARNQLGAANSQSETAFGNAQQDISQYNTNMKTLEAGKNVGAKPFQSAGYLSNVNKLQNEGLTTSANTGKANLDRWNTATGGMNRAQLPMAKRNINLQTGQLGNTLTSQRNAQDYQANLQYQQYLAGAPLAGAAINAGLYGTGTGLAGNALSNLTGTQNDVWNNVVSTNNQAMRAAAMAA